MNEVVSYIPGFDEAAWTLAEMFMVVFLLIYTIFALTIIKQVGLMFRTVELGFEKPIKFIAYMHFFISVTVLLFALFLLLV